MLARILPSVPSTSRRAYSFFSSKPGGGRSFSPNKPPKVSVAKPATAASSATPNKAGAPGSPDASSQGLPSVNGSAEGSSPQVTAEAEAAVTPLSTMSSLAAEFNWRPNDHPNPNLPTLHLHNFFAVDRPMLLLNQPVSSLFEPSKQESRQASGPSEDHLGLSNDDPDADVNAARLLARSLVMQKVGSTMEWSEVMARLGAEESDDMVINLDSVKRKRRKKMNKHRYKKRRKSQRAERRRLKK